MKKKIIAVFSVLIIAAGIVLYMHSSRRTDCLSNLHLSKFFIANVKGKKNYCKYCEKAYLGDYESFKKMVDFGFDAGANFEHGYVINSIIDVLGQEKIIEWLKKGEIDKVALRGWVIGGAHWNNTNEDGRRIWAEDKYLSLGVGSAYVGIETKLQLCN